MLENNEEIIGLGLWAGMAGQERLFKMDTNNFHLKRIATFLDVEPMGEREYNSNMGCKSVCMYTHIYMRSFRHSFYKILLIFFFFDATY